MSRESELYKDKIEVSLDGRQIFYLFFGGAVIVGLVFVLGVMVGRRVEARGHIERAHVEATVDPLAALDRLEGGSGLTFQGALRGGNGDAASDVEKMIGEIAKARQAETKKPAEKKPAEVKPAEVKPAEVKPAEPKPAEAKPAEAKVEAKVEAKPEAKPVDRKAEAKPETTKAEDKRVAEAAEPKKSDDKKPRFTLQLSSFHDRADAQAFLDGIKSSGFTPYITEGAVDGKTFYRVRLGSYRTMEAANDAKADFEKSAKKSAQVMRL